MKTAKYLTITLLALVALSILANIDKKHSSPATRYSLPSSPPSVGETSITRFSF